MAKALPLHVLVEPPSELAEQNIAALLREEHGVHGLRLTNEADEAIVPDLSVRIANEEISLHYIQPNGEEIFETTANNSRSIAVAVSNFALSQLGIRPERQTSRTDHELLSEYQTDTRPRLEADPSEWVTQNPFVAELCRKFPQYGNLVRFLCNERGLFLKVGQYPNQRAYWNSTLNGGLPIFKKADPVHEGTFMLHDMFHFVPTDPLIGPAQHAEQHKSAYIAHRLLSESSTLILADMVAVADAKLDKQGYDISKRKIFPVYQSILNNRNGSPDIDKLLAANAYFCFTGDPVGFQKLGASDESVAAFQSKYESIFRDDFMWNLHNYEDMVAERANNPHIGEYYDWIAANAPMLPFITEYDGLSLEDGTVDVSMLLSQFRADFTAALNYRKPIVDEKRTRLAYQKYLAGQRLVFARFHEQVDPADVQVRFDEHYTVISAATTAEEISDSGQAANKAIDEYIDALAEKNLLLPHEVALYRYSVPQYPIRFVNYERTSVEKKAALNSTMNAFFDANQGHLFRLLEAIDS